MRHLALAYPDRPRLRRPRGRVPVRPGPARRTGARARPRPRARPGAAARPLGRPLARRPLPRARRRPDAEAAAHGPAAASGVTLPAPLEELPLLVRAGTVLPLLAADVDTLAPTRTATRRARQPRRSPQPALAARLPARPSSVSLFNRRAARLAGGRRRLAALKLASTAAASAPTTCRPRSAPCASRSGPAGCASTAAACRAGRWSYGRDGRRLKVVFRTRRGTLTVAGC